MKRIFTGMIITALTVMSSLAVMLFFGCSLDSGREKTHVITFDTGAELTAEATKPTRSMKLEMYPGELLAELPKPDFPGFLFRGWYTGPEEGTLFETPWEVTEDIQLYAYWGREADPAKDYHVIFNAEGGAINGSASPFRLNVKRPPWTIFNLPYPVNGTKAFGGWFTELPGASPDYTKELSVITPVTGFVSDEGEGLAYAYWYDGPKEFTVTFNANGGGWGAEFSKDAKVNSPLATTVNEAGTWPANPAMASFPLVGWFTGDNVEFTGDTRVTRDFPVFAKWIYSAVPEITYGVDGSGNFLGTLGTGETVNIIENTGTAVINENGYTVLQFPNTGDALDLGQLAGSYLAEDSWTFELYINMGNTTAAGSAKVIRFYTDRGQEADGAYWMEGHGLMIVRPNNGERLNFGPGNNTWRHLAVVKDGSVIKSYVNGVLLQTQAAPAAFGNAGFKSVSHCRFMSMNNARLYQVTFTKGAKTTFPGVQAVVDGLSGL